MPDHPRSKPVRRSGMKWAGDPRPVQTEPKTPGLRRPRKSRIGFTAGPVKDAETGAPPKDESGGV